MIVKTIRSNFAVPAVATVMLLASGQFLAAPEAHAASAEIFDVDPSLQSRIAREKIKQRGPRRGARTGGSSQSGDSDNCGQVDIGNNNTQRNARSRVNPRVNITVVQGPVINAARCR